MDRNLVKKYSFKGLPKLPEETYKDFLAQVKCSFHTLGLTEFEGEYLGNRVAVKFVGSKSHRERGRLIIRYKFEVIKPQDKDLEIALREAREARLLVKKSRNFRNSRKRF